MGLQGGREEGGPVRRSLDVAVGILLGFFAIMGITSFIRAAVSVGLQDYFDEPEDDDDIDIEGLMSVLNGDYDDEEEA